MARCSPMDRRAQVWFLRGRVVGAIAAHMLRARRQVVHNGGCGGPPGAARHHPALL